MRLNGHFTAIKVALYHPLVAVAVGKVALKNWRLTVSLIINHRHCRDITLKILNNSCCFKIAYPELGYFVILRVYS